MTNIMAPESESSNIYSSYKSGGKLDNAYTFKIPIYNNMCDKTTRKRLRMSPVSYI